MTTTKKKMIKPSSFMYTLDLARVASVQSVRVIEIRIACESTVHNTQDTRYNAL